MASAGLRLFQKRSVFLAGSFEVDVSCALVTRCHVTSVAFDNIQALLESRCEQNDMRLEAFWPFSAIMLVKPSGNEDPDMPLPLFLERRSSLKTWAGCCQYELPST